MEANRAFHQAFFDFVTDVFGSSNVALHRPFFGGKEKQYVNDCVDSNFVSSVGPKVAEFEQLIARFTGARFAVATVNGTAALQVALKIAGVETHNEVLTQALTFIATCNSVSYLGAIPVFVDVDRDTMGMSPKALEHFLQNNAEKRGGKAWNRETGRCIAACVPVHTFGIPCRIEAIAEICREWGIPLIEDSAESLGSYVGSRHTGTFGLCGTISFNGNKIVTTGGGGMLITDNEAIAHRAKHITTTAKLPHPYEFVHDEIGFNYRLPNLNAALGCAQMEHLPSMLAVKRELAKRYSDLFSAVGVPMAHALPGCYSNHWLNAIILSDRIERDAFLHDTNARGVMTRPIWRLISDLPMYRDCQNDGLVNSRWLEDRVVNVPSSVPDGSYGAVK